MQAKWLLVCLFALPPAAQTVNERPARVATTPEVLDLLSLRGRGNTLYASQRYADAARVYARGAQLARRIHAPTWLAQLLNNLGGCQLRLHRYRDAMRSFLEGADAADQAGDRDTHSILLMNTASVYASLGWIDAAAETAERGMTLARGRPPNRYRPMQLLRLAVLKERQGESAEALRWFQSAIQEATQWRDWTALATALNTLGLERLQGGELTEAEQALQQARRLRETHRLGDLHLTYRSLGLLRAAQRNYRNAERWFARSLETARRIPNPSALWSVYHGRGRMRLEQGNLAGATADLRLAVRLLPANALPADDARVRLDAAQQQVYSSYLQACAGLYFKTRRCALARESFSASETHRGRGLLSAAEARREGRGTPAPEYGRLLAELHQREVALLSAPASVSLRAEIESLRRRLAELEFRTGIEAVPETAPDREEARPQLAEHVQNLLRSDQVFLSYHLGESESYAWEVTRHGIDLHRLPPREQIETGVREFVRALRSNAADASALGERLRAMLLEPLKVAATKSEWFLSLSGALWELPWAALPSGERTASGRYLVERHALQMVPSAWIAARGDPAHWRGAFLGIGDAVYNSADSRWEGPGSWFNPRRAVPASDLQLNRLAASKSEIRTCAREWNAGRSDTVLLEGRAVSKKRVLAALARRPAVCHLATHVVRADTGRDHGLIALSLAPGGMPEFLSPAEIRSGGLQPHLVAMSGCGSGLGEPVPGAGLAHLVRAWVSAGASYVAASLWPTPDDSGELFGIFYRTLRATASPAEALRQAQIDMIQSGTWRARPDYWAAYFTAGKESP